MDNNTIEYATCEISEDYIFDACRNIGKAHYYCFTYKILDENELKELTEAIEKLNSIRTKIFELRVKKG